MVVTEGVNCKSGRVDGSSPFVRAFAEMDYKDLVFFKSSSNYREALPF